MAWAVEKLWVTETNATSALLKRFMTCVKSSRERERRSTL